MSCASSWPCNTLHVVTIASSDSVVYLVLARDPRQASGVEQAEGVFGALGQGVGLGSVSEDGGDRSTMSPCSQKRVYNTTRFVFKDSAAKYKDEIKSRTDRLHSETRRNAEQEQLEKQRELTQMYAIELTALSGQVE